MFYVAQTNKHKCDGWLFLSKWGGGGGDRMAKKGGEGLNMDVDE
jgi:hypothetical protein